MIQKGKIEKVIDRYTYKVRIPKYDKIQDDASGTDTEDLADGLVCVTPGVNVSYALGDIVIVSFENDEISKPIILGLLYRENSNNIDSETSLISVDENLEGISSKISNLKSSSNIYTHLKYSNDNGLTFTSLYNPNMYERTDSLGNIYCSPAYSSRSVQGIEIDKKSKIITWFISDENNNDVTDQIGIETTLFDSNGNTLRVIPREEKNYSIILNNLSQVEDKLYMTYKIYVTKEHLDRLNVVLSTDRNTLGTQEGNYLGIYVSNNNIPSLEPSDYRWFSFAASGMSDEIAEVISELESTTGELIEQMTEVSSDIDGFRISVAEAVTMAQNVQEAAERGDFDGVGILSTEITYQESASNITVPSGTWYDEEHIPQVPDGHYLWTKTYVTYTNNTHSTSYSVAKQGIKGDTGDSGLNTASVLLYQRGSTAPTKPVGNLIYTFATGDITTDPNDPTSNLNSWTKNIPAIDGHPCWVISATASANTATDIIEYTDWSSQIKFVEDGESGGIGAHGINTAPIYLYQRSSTTPSKPTNTLTYTFSTKTISETIDNGWSANIGSLTGDDPIWIIGAVASSNTDTTTVGNSDWSIPIKLSENGEDGESISSVINYYLATSASSGVTPSTSGWTTTIQTMDATNQYLWNYEVITGSNSSTISTTTPVIIGRYGQDGSQGPSGSDGKGITSIVEWYQISDDNVHPPAIPSAQGTGYSSSPVLTTINNPYLWNYEVINYTSGDPTITDARVIGTHGEDGVDGLNQATVYIYKRSSTTPEEPSESGTYTFSTGQLTGDIIDEEGWRTYVPSGTEPCYVCTGLAISRGATATIDSWSDVVKFVENGTDGIDGYNQATLNLYQRTSSTLTISDVPSNTSYNFSTKQITGTLGNWVTSIPTGTNPCWCTSAAAISREASVNLTWSTPIKLVQDGQAGLNQATINLYRRGTSVTTPPASRYKFSEGSLVDSSGNPISSLQGWTRNVPSGSEQCWMSSASAVGREDIVTIPSWSTPIRLVKDGTSATQYYTHIRYSANADGHDYVETPTSSTKYIGIYVGTLSEAPAYNNPGWKWNKYLGDNGQNGTSVTVENIKYAITDTDTQPDTWPYDSAPEVGEGQWLWSKVTLSDGNTIISKSYSGISGADGYNQATIYLYNRSSSVSSSMPSVNVYYRFSDGKFSINNSTWTDTLTTGSGSNQRVWTKYIPSVDDNHPEYSCWVISAIAISQDDIDDISTNEWTGPNKYSENGLNQAVVRMYKRSGSAPTDRPNNTLTYRFSNGVLTPSSAFNGWTQEVPPSDSNKNPCWFIAAVASSRGNTDDITVQEWQNFTPVKFMTDGVGILRIEEEYRLSTSDQSLVPESSVESKYTWNTVQPAYEDGKYYWVRQHIFYDNGTNNYSTPVCDKSINGAVDHVINHVQQHYLSTADFSVEKDKIQSRVARTELELIGQYALCQTASTTAAKEATIIPQDQSWTLQNGTEITVQFEYRNTTDNPTLKINNQPQNGASLKDKDGNNLTEEQLHWEAGSIFLFKYDGTNWRLQDNLKLERLDKAESAITQNAHEIDLKVSDSDLTGNNIIGRINLNTDPEGSNAIISADRVHISGAAIFTSGRLSENYLNNTYDANGAAASVAEQIPDDISQLTDSTGVIPSNVSDLNNDTGFITSSALPTDLSDLTDTTGVIPSNVSDLTNDTGFITSSALPTDLSDLNNDTGFITSSSLPTNVSDLNNDTGFITSSSLPTKVSDLTNDSGFQNSSQVSTAINNATSSLASKSDAIQSVTTETQYRLSNNNDSLTGSGAGYTWNTTIPTWVANTYLWTRIATTYVPISGSSHTEYKPGIQQNEYGIYDSQLTTALSNASTALTNAQSAQETANSAANTIITTQEYRLSNSSSGLSGSGTGYTWGSSIPTWVENTYLWTRFKIDRTPISGNSTTSYTPGVIGNEYGIYDSALTEALSTASSAQTIGENAQRTADSSIRRQQTLYCRLTSSGSLPSTPLNQWFVPTVESTGYGNWSLSIPVLTNGGVEYPNVWSCIQSQTSAQYEANQLDPSDPNYSNACSYTAPVLDNSVSGLATDSSVSNQLNTLSNSIANGYSIKSNTVVRSQRIYHQGGSERPNPPGIYPDANPPIEKATYLDWVTADSGYGIWTIRRVPYSSDYRYTWCCEQTEYDDGYIKYTPVSLDDSTTVIDGGNIITNSIVAQKLNITEYMTFGSKKRIINGAYIATNDTSPVFDKQYFLKETINGIEVYTPQILQLTDDPHELELYEIIQNKPGDWDSNYTKYWYADVQHQDNYINVTSNTWQGDYFLSEDDFADTNKIYYELISEEYIPVGNPQGHSPRVEGWYELQNKVFYEDNVYDPQIVIGRKDAFAVTIDSGQLTFWYDYTPVAYLSGEQMVIPRSVMLEEMKIGNKLWSWRNHGDNLCLKWLGEVII